MINEIINFYKTAPSLINTETSNVTLGDYLKSSKLSKYFINEDSTTE